MLLSESKSEFEMLQLVAELEGSMRICYVTANHILMSGNMQNMWSHKKTTM